MPTINHATFPAAKPASRSVGSATAVAATKDAVGLLPLTTGEIVEAKVLAKSSPSKYLLSLKNYQFAADGEVNLQQGAKVMVKVEQLQPQIVLRILGQDGAVANLNLLTDSLRLYRANPEALMDIFQKGAEILQQSARNERLPESIKENIKNIQKILESLLISPASLKDPLFLKNYITKLGLSLERQWQALAGQDKSVGQQGPADSLKSSLLKLATDLQVLQKEGSVLDPAELPKVQQLAKFTEAAVKAIETQQLINVFSQESENKYLLQLPLFFPSGVRTGEIMIDAQQKGREDNGTRNKFHVVMFLDMDNLGNMMVDATLAGNKLNAVFKFADQGAQEYFSSLIDDLKVALRQAGYECDYLTCMMAADISSERKDCHREVLGEQDAVNLYA